jgi:hypothetical protein
MLIHRIWEDMNITKLNIWKETKKDQHSTRQNSKLKREKAESIYLWRVRRLQSTNPKTYK